MSDPQCLGICMIDWDAGVCLGCGRTAAEIEGTSAAADPAAAAPAVSPAPEPSAPATASPPLPGDSHEA